MTHPDAHDVLDVGALTPAQARARFRGGLVAPTSGWAAGYTQTNLVSLPADWADDFSLFARRNPQPCPVLDISPAGARGTRLAPGADLARDLPRYRVWEHGALVAEPSDVSDLWRDDLVSFHVGCSFSFETLLVAAGVPLRHVEQGVNVPMYRTRRACAPAGRLSGPLVVSMRPVPAHLVEVAVAVTARMPAVHGAPVHVGDPDDLLEGDLESPDYGHPVRFHDGDVAVFWACGVTPQAALLASRAPYAITHAPGHMLVTDVPDTAYVIDTADVEEATRA